MSLDYRPTKTANSSWMEVCNQVPLRLPTMQQVKSLMLHWLSFSRWGREWVSYFFGYKGSQYLVLAYLQPITTQIAQDVKPQFVDAALMHIARMGQRPCLSIFWSSRQPVHLTKQWRTIINILRLTVEYLSATIHRITRIAEPVIGPTRSSLTQQNTLFD
jgi:hypothetical protein